MILGNAKVGALGFRIPNQDAEAIARANAFVATADNPSAIYYNPAGITQLEGVNAQIGLLNYFGINTYYEAPTGSKSQTDFEVLPVPQIHMTYSLKDQPLSFGIGAYAPYGLGVKWPTDTGFQTLAIESRLQYMTVNAVVAWKPHKTLSISAGPTFNYSHVDFIRGLATPTDRFEFDADGTAWGFNAGILWQPLAKWSFGATYRSATQVEYSGSSTYNPGISIPPANTSGNLNFPQIVSAGISFRPTPKWNIEVGVDWSDWSVLKSTTLHGTSQLGFPVDLPLQFNWHDSWFYQIGATRYIGENWFVSAGYFYSGDTASTEYYSPAVPDTNLHVGSLGVGYKGDHWRWAAAAQIITGPERQVKNSQPNPFTGQSADGNYRLVVPALTVSLGYHF
jgi:long-chain fatty acid transport protein